MARNYLKLLNNSLKGHFYNLGHSIGKNPVPFIIITILTSFFLGTGVQQYSFINDGEYLFAPVTGRAQNEREIMKQIFPLNYSLNFDPSRLFQPERTTRIFITAKDGGSLLRSSVWREIRELNELVRNMKIVDSELEFRFQDLCARRGDICYDGNILELGAILDDIKAGNITLTYPVTFNPKTFNTIIFPVATGGRQLSNLSTVEDFKALQQFYFFDHQSPLKNIRAQKWETAMMDTLKKLDKKWEFIKVDPATWTLMNEEIDMNNFSAIYYAFFTVPVMILFSALTSMSSDWVRSKPWLGIAGFVCPVLGCVMAFGLLCYLGVPLCSLLTATPFLMLGIGVDDSFVMVGAWRQTKVTDPVAKRLGHTFSEAGISITITSLTDALSFWVGVVTPFPAVRIFSVYAGTAVIGTYLSILFLFGGAMALSGYHEAENRHGLFFWLECTPKSKLSPNKGWLHRKFWLGGIDPADPENPLNDHESRTMTFFRDTLAFYLNKPKGKALVLILFSVYIGFSIWGITRTKEGMLPRRLMRDGSQPARFLDTEATYFRDFPYRIQLAITGDLDYADVTVQKRIEKMMREFESSKYVSHEFTESWLRGFLSLVERYKSVDLDLNVRTETEFIQSLRSNYLGSSSPLSDDVKFNENYTKIMASRFILQAVDVHSPQEEMEMVTSLRAIAQAQSSTLNVSVYNWYFLFIDGNLNVRSLTMHCLMVTGLIMIVVAIIFIPNLNCSLWVAFSIVSTEVGVLGFLAFWQVDLDGLSMINLIMGVGFAVDFSAHISYAYLSEKSGTPEERVKSCLYSLGWPIVQGALSSVIGITSLAFSTSYIHLVFFKSILLVMVITAAHGLLLLPVLLSFFGPGGQYGGLWRKTTVTLSITPLKDKD